MTNSCHKSSSPLAYANESSSLMDKKNDRFPALIIQGAEAVPNWLKPLCPYLQKWWHPALADTPKKASSETRDKGKIPEKVFTNCRGKRSDLVP